MSTTTHPLAAAESLSTPRGVYGREMAAELTKLLRNRAYSIAVAGFPVIFYVMFGTMNRHVGPQGDAIARYMLAGYSCFGAMGAALFGIGNGLAFERSHGWLELKRASPMPAGAYLTAKLAASIVFSLAITLLLAAVGPLVFGHRFFTFAELAQLLVMIAGGAIPFASMGLLFGLLIPPSAGPGFVNLIYLPLSFLGGLWWPVEQLPHVLQVFAHVLPSYWFSRIALHALGQGSGAAWTAYAVLAGYTVASLGLSAKVWAASEAKA